MRNNLLALHARTAKTFHMLNFGLSLFVYPAAKAAVYAGYTKEYI